MLFFVVTAQGQSLDVEKSAKTESQSPRSFVCVAWEPLPFEVFYFDGDDYKSVDLRIKQRSKPYELPAGELFQIFREREEAAGEIVYEIAGSASIPTHAEVTLFLLSQAPPDAEVPLRMFGIDDSMKAFPPGSFRFFNVSGRSLLIRINETNIEIGPREIQVIQPEIPEFGGFIPFFIADKASKRIIYETKFYGQRSGRNMGFILIEAEDDRPDRVRIRFLTELVRVEPPPSKL